MPSLEELKRQIVAEKGDKWLQDKIKEHEEVYGSAIEDPALKLWMIAKANGINVADIKADTGGTNEGQRIDLVEFTDKLALEETKKSETKENGLWSVEGLVTSDLEQGHTQKGGDKVSFFLQDATGRVKVVAYNDEAISLLANARVSTGKYIRLPLVGMLAGHFKGRVWKQLTIPPFGRVEIVEGKDFRDVYKNPNKDAFENGDAIYLEGVVTVLDPDVKDACSACGRWVTDDAEKNAKAHADCGEYEIVEQTSYRGTIALGNASTFAFNVGNWLGKPDFPVGIGISRLFGIWNGEYKNLKVQRWETVAAPGMKAGATSVPVKSSPKPSPKASPKPAPAPAKAPEPEPEPEAEPEAEEAEASSVEFNPSIIAGIPEGVPSPTNATELAALASDFRGLQALAKHLGINARQKVPVLMTEITAKLTATSAPAPAAKAAPAKPAASKPAPAPAAGAAPALGDVIVEALREMGPMSEDDLFEAVKLGIPSVERAKFNFFVKMKKSSGGLVWDGDNVSLPSTTPEPAEEVEHEEAEEEEEEEPEAAPTPAVKEARALAKKDPKLAGAAAIFADDAKKMAAAKEAPKSPPPKAAAAPSSIPASTGEIPEAVVKHFEDYVREFGGENRTIVVVNNAIPANVVTVSEAEIKQHGDKDEAIRQKLYGYMNAAVEKGILKWVGQWTTENGVQKPPKKVAWAGEE